MCSPCPNPLDKQGRATKETFLHDPVHDPVRDVWALDTLLGHQAEPLWSACGSEISHHDSPNRDGSHWLYTQTILGCGEQESSPSPATQVGSKGTISWGTLWCAAEMEGQCPPGPGSQVLQRGSQSSAAQIQESSNTMDGKTSL